MNALLLYPEMPATFWSMDHLMRIIGKKASYPPLGLLTIAALLPSEWKKRLVDLNVRPLGEEDLRWADLAFVGAMNVQAAAARALIARCREAGVPIVAGGPLFTHEWEKFAGVDHFVLGEAEITLPQFLADLEAGRPGPIYASKAFADVHRAPIPLWELVDLRRYAYGIVQYSRGCPYHCDFCDVTALFGRVPRTKTAAQIIAELEALGDLRRFDLVLFADDNLIGNKKALKTDLLPALIDWRGQRQPTVGFATQTTINLADDPELMELMLEAGFRHLFIGIETPDESSLVACKKGQNTRRDLLADVGRLQRAGFIVTAGFIVGFDTDTPSVFRRQIDFIQESGIVIATINLLKAPPGTELHERLKREGRLIEPFDFDEARTNIVSLMDAGTLERGYRSILAHIYAPAAVHWRARAFLQENPRPRVRHPVSRGRHWRDLGILFRLLLRAGLMGKERACFWRLLGWALRHRPERLVLALLFAALMHQFRRMSDAALRVYPLERQAAERAREALAEKLSG
jgi:radical SAM superfamily enzyme YgiQ (UPF0313 family)